MKLRRKVIDTCGIRLSIESGGKEMARAYLYILRNDLHEEPVGYLEDVFVGENLRNQGLGRQIVREIIEEAKRNGCYKLIATSRHSRPGVHKFYESLGFKNYGFEFRLDFSTLR